MHKLRRIDLERSEEIFEKLRELASVLKSRYGAKKVYLYGSFARREFHEGSDIDLIVVGDFGGKMWHRIQKVLDLTDLPVEPLVYTEAEFEEIKDRPFFKNVLADAVEL